MLETSLSFAPQIRGTCLCRLAVSNYLCVILILLVVCKPVAH